MVYNDEISIRIGGAVGFGVVCVDIIHGYISKATEKAVQFRRLGGQETIWLPKKALVQIGENNYKLARWFRPDKWQQKFFEKYAETYGTNT